MPTQICVLIGSTLFTYLLEAGHRVEVSPHTSISLILLEPPSSRFVGLSRVFVCSCVQKTAMYMFVVAALALALPAFAMVRTVCLVSARPAAWLAQAILTRLSWLQNHTVRLLAFFVFEICCGMFWPSLGFMRSKYVVVRCPSSDSLTLTSFELIHAGTFRRRSARP